MCVGFNWQKIIPVHFNVCFLFERFTYCCHNYRRVRQELIPHTIMIDGNKKHNLQLIFKVLSSCIIEKAQ